MNAPSKPETAPAANPVATNSPLGLVPSAQNSPAPPGLGEQEQPQPQEQRTADTSPGPQPTANSGTPTQAQHPSVVGQAAEASAVERVGSHNKLRISPMLGKTEVLSEAAQADYYACEEVIASGWNTFVQVGLALARIRDGELYRAGGYDSFEQYCRLKWEYGPNYVHRLISAAQVFTNLLTNSQKKPERETQVRPLVGLTADQARMAWERAVQKAAGGKITAAIVRSAVRQLGLDGSEKAWPASPARVEPKGAA